MEISIEQLTSLFVILQQLSSTQINSIISFVRSKDKTGEDTVNAPTFLASINSLFQTMSSQQLQQLISLNSIRQNESEYKEQIRKNLEPFAKTVGLANTKELEISFDLLISIYYLQLLLRELSVLQLMKLFESMPQGPPIKQLQLLQQIQQLFSQLQADALQNLYRQLQQAQPGTENQMLTKILDLPADYFQLYQPLRLLLQLDLDELLKLQESLPKLNAAQMLQLLQLLQLQAYDVLELRTLLANREDNMDPSIDPIPPIPTSSSQPILKTPITNNNNNNSQSMQVSNSQSQKKLSIQIVEHPPEKSVYKRNLKPNPTVMLVGDTSANDTNLFVVPMLFRCDTLTEESKYLTGNKPMRVSSGRLLTFRKIKVLTTSHQQQETLFCLKFELRRYLGEGEDDYELLDGIFTNPISVLSHSTQMKPNTSQISSGAPTIMEVVPGIGPTCGGTKVVIIGKNFVDNPTLYVRFDSIEVKPIFHGPGTLVCITPAHQPGTILVRVCNSPKKWSDTSARFTYDSSIDSTAYQPIYNSVPSSENTSSSATGTNNTSNNNASSTTSFGGTNNMNSTIANTSSISSHQKKWNTEVSLDSFGFSNFHYAAANGNFSWCLQILLKNIKNKYRILNFKDRLGCTPLFWACFFGYLDVVRLLLYSGANARIVNEKGLSPLYIAVLEGHFSIVQLLLQFNVSINTSTNYQGSVHSLLHIAASLGYTKILNCLLKCGVNRAILDDRKETCLHWAIRENQMEAVQLLLQNSHSSHVSFLLHSPNEDGETPLDLAISIQNQCLIQLLLKHQMGLHLFSFIQKHYLEHILPDQQLSLLSINFYSCESLWTPIILYFLIYQFTITSSKQLFHIINASKHLLQY